MLFSLDPVISVTRFKEIQRGLIICTESLQPSSEIPSVEKKIRLFAWDCMQIVLSWLSRKSMLWSLLPWALGHQLQVYTTLGIESNKLEVLFHCNTNHQIIAVAEQERHNTVQVVLPYQSQCIRCCTCKFQHWESWCALFQLLSMR